MTDLVAPPPASQIRRRAPFANIVPGGDDIAGDLAALLEEACTLAEGSRSPATRKAYTRDFETFSRWCTSRGQTPLPARPELVAAYLAHLAETYAPSTIDRALVAIGQAHRAAGHTTPAEHELVRQVRRGVRRRLGVAPHQKAALVAAQLRTLVETFPADLAGVRDRALLTLGFAGALRRSELVGLDVPDLVFVDEGVRVTIRKSKTDQEGEGRTVGVPCGSTSACPVRALRAWIEAASRTEGPVFVGVTRWGDPTEHRLDGRDVARILQRRATASGIDARELAGHSLRAGLVTSAARAGSRTSDIMATTGHTTEAMVRRYERDADLFAKAPSRGLL